MNSLKGIFGPTKPTVINILFKPDEFMSNSQQVNNCIFSYYIILSLISLISYSKLPDSTKRRFYV